jgi:endonuclease YncB( thermonuclease family)
VSTSRLRSEAIELTRYVLAIGLLAAGLVACDRNGKPPAVEQAERPTAERSSAAADEQRAESAEAGPVDLDGLEPQGHLQEAELRDLPGSVVDGDTVKAVGFSESIRLLHIDTEETFKRKADRKQAERDWQAYLQEQTDGDDFATFGTPMGEQAKAFARDFFEGAEPIWVEYESIKRTRGFFGRHLAYVWIKRGEQERWVNYNVEAVRAGMSPYYPKYGASEHYHRAFVAAQEEARQAERGIWAPGAKSYPDYDERTAHWAERAEQIAAFRERFDDHPHYVDLAADTAFSDLRNRLGRRMVVFGESKSFAEHSNPQRIRLSHRYQQDLTVVAFEPLDMRDSGLSPRDEDYLYVEGVVAMYRGDPQIRFDEDSWLRSGKNPPDPP